eukprot:519418-Amphidinium_carterae.1
MRDALLDIVVAERQKRLQERERTRPTSKPKPKPAPFAAVQASGKIHFEQKLNSMTLQELQEQ